MKNRFLASLLLLASTNAFSAQEPAAVSLTLETKALKQETSSVLSSQIDSINVEIVNAISTTTIASLNNDVLSSKTAKAASAIVSNKEVMKLPAEVVMSDE